MKTNMNIENINIMNANSIARQYYPLACKVAHQLHSQTGYDMDMCISAGNEGLDYAIRNYNTSKQEGKKQQSFLQYAAYMIRFSILNDINQNGHTIRVNQGQQKKLKESGESVELCTSMNAYITYGANGDERNTLENKIAGQTEASIYAALDPSEEELWGNIKKRLDSIFTERDVDIFYSTFGVCGYEEMNGKDVAAKYNVSPGAITQVRNKIVKFIQKDRGLRDDFLSILQLREGNTYSL